MQYKNLVIIPARGGSKGVPRKNILEINGIPLINYTITPALELQREGWINEVIVSTDDQEIADISQKAGASVPFIRPADLAGDQAKSVDVLIHAIDYFQQQGIRFQYIILLQPTTPLRSRMDLMAAIELFESNHVESLISCYEEDYICDLVSYYRENDFAIPLNTNHNAGTRRQDNRKLYIRNGAIYITRTEYLLQSRKVISDQPLIYVMPKIKSINIDTPYDLELAQWMLSK